MTSDDIQRMTETCRHRRPHLGPTDPIRVAATVLIVCTKEAGHQSPHYDASCDVSWPNEPEPDASGAFGLDW